MSIIDRNTSPSYQLYDQLRSSPTFEVIEENPPSFSLVEHFRFVDEGDFVIAIGNNWALGTAGVTNYIATCLIGVNRHGTSVLGLCHTTSPLIKKVLTQMQKEMVHRGAVEATIEIFAVGRVAPLKNSRGPLLEEVELVMLAEKMNIKGVKFNLTEGEEDSLDVIFTAQKIRISKKALFNCADESLRVGTRLQY